MTATDELRRLLDERGVEWGDDGYQTTCTVWASDGIVWHGLWRDDCIELIAHLTPQQAIDATLGRGTCHDVGDPSDFCCSECGVRMFTEVDETYTMIARDERTIIKQPNYCPNCGRKVEP